MTETSFEPPEPRHGRPRRVAGLAIRTTNAEEGGRDTAQIPGLWGRFAGEDWFGRLERLGAEGPLLAVYSDYESDVSGRYRLLVGRELASPGTRASAIEIAETPEGDYLVFRCRGPLPGVVMEGWRRVWDLFARPGAPDRAYTADIEVYDGDGGGLEIWVAVKGAATGP